MFRSLTSGVIYCVHSTEATSDQSASVWQADTRNPLGAFALSGAGAFQAQRAAREAIEDAQAVEFPIPPGFLRERVTTWKQVVGLAVPIGSCRTAPSRPWSPLLSSARAWSGSLILGRTALTIDRRENHCRNHPDFRQSIRLGQKCDRRSRRATIGAASSLTAAPAAQDNAAWLAGEVLAGEAAASLDP
jgi:hypothetical protein